MSRGQALFLKLRALMKGPPKSLPAERDSADDFVVVSMSESDQALQQAIEDGRKTLLYCLDRLASHPERNTDYALKVGFPTDHGPEYLWLIPLELNGDRVRGALMHDPMFLRGKRQWSKVNFRLDQIVDWSIKEGDAIYGHFTTRALAKTRPEALEDLTKHLAATPLPPDAQAWAAQP